MRKMDVKPITVKDLDAYIAGSEKPTSLGSSAKPPAPKAGVPKGPGKKKRSENSRAKKRGESSESSRGKRRGESSENSENSRARNATKGEASEASESSRGKQSAESSESSIRSPVPAVVPGMPAVIPGKPIAIAKPPASIAPQALESSAIQNPGGNSEMSENTSGPAEQSEGSAPPAESSGPPAEQSESSAPPPPAPQSEASAPPAEQSESAGPPPSEQTESSEAGAPAGKAAAASVPTAPAEPIRLTEDSQAQPPATQRKPRSARRKRSGRRPKPAAQGEDPLDKLLREEEENARRIEQQAQDEKYRLQLRAAALQDELLRADQGKVTTRAPMPAVPFGKLKLVNSHTAYMNGFTEPQFRIVGRMCYLSGMVRLGTVAESQMNVIAVTPANCRSASRRIFESAGFAVANMRIDVMPNGDIVLLYFAGRTTWLSLSGIAFPVENAVENPITLIGPWRALGHNYSKPTFVKDGDMCFLSGAVDGSALEDWSSTPLLKMGSDCQVANGRLTLLANQNRDGHRVDVFPDGNVTWIAGQKTKTFLSLDGMAFSARAQDKDGLREVTLQNGWTHWGDGFRRAAVDIQGPLCALSGTVRSPAGKPGVVTQLPVGCRPDGRLVFVTHSRGRNARFDVFPDGNVVLVDLENAPSASPAFIEAAPRRVLPPPPPQPWFLRSFRIRPKKPTVHQPPAFQMNTASQLARVSDLRSQNQASIQKITAADANLQRSTQDAARIAASNSIATMKREQSLRRDLDAQVKRWTIASQNRQTNERQVVSSKIETRDQALRGQVFAAQQGTQTTKLASKNAAINAKAANDALDAIIAASKAMNVEILKAENERAKNLAAQEAAGGEGANPQRAQGHPPGREGQ